MSGSSPRRMHEHSLLMYFILACAISWSLEIPLALRAQKVVMWPVPYPMHYLAAYGPMLAALIVTGFTDGTAGFRRLFSGLLQWRTRPIWWLVATSPLILAILIAVVLRFVPGQAAHIRMLGQVDFLPAIGLGALPLWILTFGIGEEMGWRGYLLPRLQQNRTVLSATLLLWGLWSFWHLPLFFYSYDVSVLPGLLVGLLAGTIVFSWLYNSTGGSVLICAVWHGLFNFTTACTACQTGLMAAIISTAVMLWAVVVVVLLKPADLSTFREQLIKGRAVHNQ